MSITVAHLLMTEYAFFVSIYVPYLEKWLAERIGATKPISFADKQTLANAFDSYLEAGPVTVTVARSFIKSFGNEYKRHVDIKVRGDLLP